MIYTEKEVRQFLDDAVDKDIIVYDCVVPNNEFSIRLLGLLRKIFRKEYYTHPKYLLIDKNHEDDLKLPVYQIQLLPLQYDLPIDMILGYKVIYVDGLQKMADLYQETHKDIYLKIKDKSKIVIVKNDENSLLGVY